MWVSSDFDFSWNVWCTGLVSVSTAAAGVWGSFTWISIKQQLMLNHITQMKDCMHLHRYTQSILETWLILDKICFYKMAFLHNLSKKTNPVPNLTNSPSCARAILHYHSCTQFQILFLFSSEQKGTSVACCQLWFFSWHNLDFFGCHSLIVPEIHLL